MSEIGVADAARNNASWCDAVCSAHGKPGEFFDSHWLTRAPAPPYHPNLVTLSPAVAPAMAAVQELERSRPSTSWAVKDSFGVLPLEQTGFRLLFGAEWIVRSAGSRSRVVHTRWGRVESESALSAWEDAWGESLGQSRIFLPALLHRKDVAILAAFGEGDAILAGVVANQSENVVGLSNFFARGKQDGSLRAECIEAAAQAFPGLPLVGYESGKNLAGSHALGFSSLGQLRVWITGDH
jgi:hypothetical protein